jgi:hypothetical protein
MGVETNKVAKAAVVCIMVMHQSLNGRQLCAGFSFVNFLFDHLNETKKT